MKIADVKLREPLFVRPDIGLLEMLGIFQEGQCHLAVVTADPACAATHLRSGQAPPNHACIQGIVTLEDVLEKVIQGDITDETDTFGVEAVGGSRKGVVTTTLSRKINRAHTVSDLLSGGSGSGGGLGEDVVSDRRRSRSRTNLHALSSINVVAGDVRHKERPGRESFSPVQRDGPNPYSPPKGLDCLDDVVDTVIVSCELDLGGESDGEGAPGFHHHEDRESVGLRMSTLGMPGEELAGEDFVQVEATENTHLLAPKTASASAGTSKKVKR